MSESPDADKSMYFASVIRAAVKARAAAEGDVEVRTGAKWLSDRLGVPLMTVSGWLSEPRKGWISIDNTRDLGDTLFRGDHGLVYVANAVSAGLRPPRTGGGAFGATQPSWVDDLPQEELNLVRDLIYTLGKAHGLTE